MSIQLKLEKFEGPLDLLLHLIDKHKVDIYDIPIAEITNQYLEYIRLLDKNRMDVMSEFIEMAATLINIKSKMLLPAVDDDEEEVDPRRELVEKLIEYKKFKLIAESLKEQKKEASRMVFKEQSIPEEILNAEPEIDTDALLAGIDFTQLYKIFEEVLKKKEDKIDPIRSKFGEIKKETFTVDDKVQLIFEMCNDYETFSFYDLLDMQKSKDEVIITFLAILEMMKMGVIKIIQEALFGEIVIKFIGREHHHGD
ncbi:MAG: segregation/condensation protein A [Vallitaleaceae bacterium]|jgi:segregation and condensation protein A|nr:segregation/condensation protein A [Vallitaleaceae bacterium]